MNRLPIWRNRNEKRNLIRLNTVEAKLGEALEWAIQRWVCTTGRRVRTTEASWLAGPFGGRRIGVEFYEAYARDASLEAVTDEEDVGLLTDFDALAGEGFDPSLVRPEIRGFYERTARYDFTVQIEWSGPFKYPPRTLIYLVGRNVKQFDIPLSLRVTDVMMENELIRLVDPITGDTPYVGWLRRSVITGEAMLAGLYTTCELPRVRGRFFKGVYPLPGGSATTIFRPANRADGSFALVSDQRRFGEAGYYRIHRTNADTLRVKCVPMEEVIHVFVDSTGVLSAHHTFTFAKFRFLSLHYKIMPRHGAQRT